MIKEALEFLAKIQTPKNPITTAIGSHNYKVQVDGTLGDLILKPKCAPLQVIMLTALVEAYTARLDGLDPAMTGFHVVDHLGVELIGLADDESGRRHVYARAQHKPETDFQFGTYYSSEDFIIKFRASFYFNDEAVKVQQLCSTLDANASVNVSDDGISQTVVVSSGSISKATVTLPAEGVPLIPWRTFREVAPVESRFLLRMKAVDKSAPKIALFELDAKWKVETSRAIAEYLAGLLPEKVTIFA